MVISDFAIKRPMITVVVMLALVVFGLFALALLQTDEFPDVAVPLVDVTTESTLAAGRRLGAGTAALVFASARNPGGGFLGHDGSNDMNYATAVLFPKLDLAEPPET